MLPTLEQYQLDYQDISAIKRAIIIAEKKLIRKRSGRARSSTVRAVTETLIQHLLISDLRVTNEVIHTFASQQNLFLGVWYDTHKVLVREMQCDNFNQLHSLQAVANQLFRLRHPYFHQFIGIYHPHPLHVFNRGSRIFLAFEYLEQCSLMDWMYSSEGQLKFVHVLGELKS